MKGVGNKWKELSFSLAESRKKPYICTVFHTEAHVGTFRGVGTDIIGKDVYLTSCLWRFKTSQLLICSQGTRQR